MPRGYNVKLDPVVCAAIRTEEFTGVRFCTTCEKVLPLSEFGTDKRRYMCIKHYRELRKHYTMGSQEKRAFNSLRSRAYQDMVALGQKRLIMSRKQIIDKLTDEQLADYSNHALIPKRPDLSLTEINAIIVTSAQRSYIMSNWRKSRDPEQYFQDLIFIMKKPKQHDKNEGPSTKMDEDRSNDEFISINEILEARAHQPQN